MRTPLYQRDVHKTDWQDDNAAAHLFSAPTLKFLCEKHPEYLGEIIYLFVFRELIDAYQNRNIGHQERIKLVLRARYFVDSWRTYLEHTEYSETKYLLSCESVDIIHYLIDGLIGLVLVYRDHLDSHIPLLPWLHSTETCEHVFGEARKIVKDFTMLDLFYMFTKLRVKLHEAVLRSHSADYKARANGYCHTYVDTQGIDLRELARFPTDAEIQDTAKDAMDKCESLLFLLGIDPGMVRRILPTKLSTINSWFDPRNTDGDDSSMYGSDVDGSEDKSNEASELQACMDYIENNKLSLSHEQDCKVTKLSCTAMAIVSDEMGRM